MNLQKENKTANQVAFEQMFFNTTPHAINLFLDSEILTLPKAEKPWRLQRHSYEGSRIKLADKSVSVNSVAFGPTDFELPETTLEVYLEVGNDDYMEDLWMIYDPSDRPELSMDEYITSVYGSEYTVLATRVARYYVVSKIFADAYPDRDDFLIVDDLVRDDEGNIVGCRAFSTNK